MDTRGRRILAIVHIDVLIIQLFPFGATFYKVLTHLTINTGISSLNYMLEKKQNKPFIIYVTVLSHFLYIYTCILMCGMYQYILNHIYCYCMWNFIVFE